MRKGSIHRISKETQIQASLTIEGRGHYQVSTGIRFFDHMLELFAHHGGFDLKLKARGDLDVAVRSGCLSCVVEWPGVAGGRTPRRPTCPCHWLVS